MTRHAGATCPDCGGTDPVVSGPVIFNEGTCTCVPDGPWTLEVCRRHRDVPHAIKSKNAPFPCCYAGPWVPIQVVRQGSELDRAIAALREEALKHAGVNTGAPEDWQTPKSPEFVFFNEAAELLERLR